MPLSLHTAALLRKLEHQPNLHQPEKRQPFPKTEEGLKQFSEAIDTFYLGLDESEHDGAPGEKGLVRYHTGQGERLQARYEGNSSQGKYLQEWVNGGFMLTRFSDTAVDNYQVGPRGSHHVHLDRKDPDRSFVTVEGAGVPLLADSQGAPTVPPTMPADSQVTEGGVGYGILRQGQGSEHADKGENVMVHYTGWLENGQKFDSSHDRGQPFQFQLGGGRVIKGWEQGVEGMQAGEKRLLHIPAPLAYGERGRGSIPANSPLIFEVELLATTGELEKPA